MDIKSYVKTYFEQIDWNQKPKNLYEPIDYALQSGGKRIRPTLVLMAAQIFGVILKNVLNQLQQWRFFIILHCFMMM